MYSMREFTRGGNKEGLCYGKDEDKLFQARTFQLTPYRPIPPSSAINENRLINNGNSR